MRSGRSPPIIFAGKVRPTFTTLPLKVFTQRNFVADFFKRSAILRGKRPLCVFERPPPWATYDDHLRLIGKCVLGFLLMIIELFFARCYV